MFLLVSQFLCSAHLRLHSSFDFSLSLSRYVVVIAESAVDAVFSFSFVLLRELLFTSSTWRQ